MAEPSRLDLSEPVPIFPLPQCVLLPHATIPLHIFEPRYRRMISDVLSEQRVVAMAVFDGDLWKQQYQGSPPVRPCVCVGQIVRHEKMGDGRYNILLQGICRARISREVPHAPYRRALLELIEPDFAMDIDLVDHRGEIETLLGDKLLQQLAAVHAIKQWLNPDIPTVAAIDLAIMLLCDRVEGRYRMLSEPDAQVRAQWLTDLLRQTRRTLAIARRFEPPPHEDDWQLN